jgi:hypothetical protein
MGRGETGIRRHRLLQFGDALVKATGMEEKQAELIVRDVVAPLRREGVPPERLGITPDEALAVGQDETGNEDEGEGDPAQRWSEAPFSPPGGEAPDRHDEQTDVGEVGVAIRGEVIRDRDETARRKDRHDKPEPSRCEPGRLREPQERQHRGHTHRNESHDMGRSRDRHGVREEGDETERHHCPLQIRNVGQTRETGAKREREIGRLADELVPRPGRPGHHRGHEGEDGEGDLLDNPLPEERPICPVLPPQPAERPEIDDEKDERERHETRLRKNPEHRRHKAEDVGPAARRCRRGGGPR